MSLTCTVLAAVPSFFHSSQPFVSSKALKNSVPFTLVRSFRYARALPGRMSLISVVPASVPLLSGPAKAWISVTRDLPDASRHDAVMAAE
jgi:hypothetical protein